MMALVAAAGLLSLLPMGTANSMTNCDGPVCAMAAATADYQDNTWPQPNSNTYSCAWHGGSTGLVSGEATGSGPDMIPECTGSCTYDAGSGCGNAGTKVELGMTDKCSHKIQETTTASGGQPSPLARPLFYAVALATADPCVSTDKCDYLMVASADGCDALPSGGCFTQTSNANDLWAQNNLYSPDYVCTLLDGVGSVDVCTSEQAKSFVDLQMQATSRLLCHEADN
jgi:hypothetical protein